MDDEQIAKMREVIKDVMVTYALREFLRKLGIKSARAGYAYDFDEVNGKN